MVPKSCLATREQDTILLRDVTDNSGSTLVLSSVPLSPQLANLHTRLSFLMRDSSRSLRLALSMSLSHFSRAFCRLWMVLRMLRTWRYGHLGMPYCRQARFSLFREMPRARAADETSRAEPGRA